MIKIRMGDVFGGFDDAELIELEEQEDKKTSDEKGKLNDYKQN